MEFRNVIVLSQPEVNPGLFNPLASLFMWTLEAFPPLSLAHEPPELMDQLP